jgi:hypothetical protein
MKVTQKKAAKNCKKLRLLPVDEDYIINGRLTTKYYYESKTLLHSL